MRGAGIAAVCDRDGERARRRAEEFGIERVYTDPAEMLHAESLDFLDVVTILPVAGITAYLLHQIGGGFPLAALGLYALLLVNGLLIAFAIHVAVASLAVLTQEMENTIWIYRDLMTLGRFPSDIYAPVMRGVITFAIPIAVMISFPAKAFLGKLPPGAIGIAFGAFAASVTVSLWFWRLANRRYTSLSS